jgi:hypothetical protein
MIVKAGLAEPWVGHTLPSAVVEARDGHSVAVTFVGERDPVVREREQLVEHADDSPVVVVAHVLAQGSSPVSAGEHVLGPADRQRRDGLDRKAAGERRSKGSSKGGSNCSV